MKQSPKERILVLKGLIMGFAVGMTTVLMIVCAYQYVMTGTGINPYLAFLVSAVHIMITRLWYLEVTYTPRNRYTN